MDAPGNTRTYTIRFLDGFNCGQIKSKEVALLFSRCTARFVVFVNSEQKKVTSKKDL